MEARPTKLKGGHVGMQCTVRFIITVPSNSEVYSLPLQLHRTPDHGINVQ